jgi:hypothetical protein
MGEITPNDSRQYRGWVKIGSGDYFVDIDKDGKLNIKIDDNVTSVAGGQESVFVQDDESRNLLNSLLKQLKITNMHLSIMTDNYFKTSDVET